MCTDIAEVCYYLQNLFQLMLINPQKLPADSRLYLWFAEPIHFGKCTERQSMDEHPERYVLMLLFLMLDVDIFCGLYNRWFQVAIDKLCYGSTLFCCRNIIVLRR